MVELISKEDAWQQAVEAFVGPAALAYLRHRFESDWEIEDMPKENVVPLQKVAFGIEALDFLEKLDALMVAHGARLVIQRTYGEHALQVRFDMHAATALTLAKARPGRDSIVYAGDGFERLGKQS